MKSSTRELAVFGGTPAFSMPLHVGRPNIGDRSRLLERLSDILDQRWLTNDGKYCREFERMIAEKAGTKHCVAVCNGTIALEIAIRALDLHGKVIVPAFTFVATAHALEWQGITPVFCDVDPVTHNISPTAAEAALTKDTTGIIGVHLWGRACEIEQLTALASKSNLSLIFDASHAFGCSYRGQPIGSFGEAEVFSFHATKVLNSFEGGGIVTNNGDLARKMRLMRNFGFAGSDNVIHVGTNGKMTEPAAAMGITSLESLDSFVATNKDNYDLYSEELADLPGVSMLKYDESESCNYHYLIIEIEESMAGINRDQLVEILTAENVLARRYFYPGCHRMEPYRSRDPDAGSGLPHTESLGSRVASLPTGTSITTKDISAITQIVRIIVNNSAEVTELLKIKMSQRK